MGPVPATDRSSDRSGRPHLDLRGFAAAAVKKDRLKQELTFFGKANDCQQMQMRIVVDLYRDADRFIINYVCGLYYITDSFLQKRWKIIIIFNAVSLKKVTLK